MKRDGYRDKYTKPKRKVEYNLTVQAKKKQKRPQPTKRLQNKKKKPPSKTRQKLNAQFANFISKSSRK